MATISVPEPRLLVIQPWDASMIGPIEKAIQKSDLGLNPNNDGTVIDSPCRRSTSSAATTWRSRSRGAPKSPRSPSATSAATPTPGSKKLEKDGKLSQDELRRALDRVQKLTDSSIKQVDEAADRKEKEVKEV